MVPNVVMAPNGRSYDLNSWQRNASAPAAPRDFGSPLEMEGYGRTGHLYLHKLRHMGDLVRLDGVGGAVLLVQADLHRQE